ncbi:pre-mRNA-splicing factor SYF1, putative [Plasmodium malariae]|uniref:Pre-mRNA-splicing factor SYF1 n=1 Tax=Plasmodium malariae TaxID=5858 RepID=A0A1C3L379_PLAMA|nr:pre-mRNA-splicing factor SYF1, putative [Plasmodium malariae]
MELYGELYDYDDLFFNENNVTSREEAFYDEKDYLVDGMNYSNKFINSYENTENEKYLKSIEIDIKSNLEKVSTKYLFLYINKFKEKNIKKENNLYVLNMYDIHLKKDKLNVLETENNIVEYCLTELINGGRKSNVKGGLKKGIMYYDSNVQLGCSHIGNEDDEEEHEQEKLGYDEEEQDYDVGEVKARGYGKKQSSDEDENNSSNGSERTKEYYLRRIYQVVLKYFPFSFKLWYNYIRDSIEMIKDVYYDNRREYEQVNAIFEKCLLYMYHFKSIYIMYIQFLYIQRKVQKIREVFNRSLQNVFLNQHEDLWFYQLEYNEKINNKLINYEYIKRYITIYPEQVIFLFDHYVKYKMYKHAIGTFFYILNCEEETLDLGNKSKYDLYKEIFNLISSAKVLNNDVMEILKKNINIFKNYENVTSIFILLANNYVYEGRWNKAMDSYEEGISECYTVNDFSILFENYIETLKVLIDLKINQQEEKRNTSTSALYVEEEKEAIDNELISEGIKPNDDFVIDLYMEKINYLLDVRKIFIADIKLKNNKNNVYIWLSKIDAVANDTDKVDLFNKCLIHFEHNEYIGRLSDVYISYAYYYYNRNKYDESVKVFHRAIKEKNFKNVNEMANIFCSWVELELLQSNYKEALNVARLAIDIGRGKSFKRKAENGATFNAHNTSRSGENDAISIYSRGLRDSTVGDVLAHTEFNLLNSTKLMCLILDMEINYGTVETSISMFDVLYHAKSITVKMVLSFANFLYTHKYFNECFKIYEKAISIFHYPYLYPIYANYINKYIERYKDKNISYVRELFKQAIYGIDNKTYIPKEFAKYIFFMYALFEENYGFLKNSLSIYKEAIPFLEEKDKATFYKMFIWKISKSYGVHKAREAFEEAIQTLKDDDFTNPLAYSKFYQVANLDTMSVKIDWREFEALHGNEHTFRDMIRIKRSVLSIFTSSHRGVKEIEKDENSNLNVIENTKRILQEMIENEERLQKKIKNG